jgi:fructokinase
VAIGEVLWDLLPEGRKLGGAPANFAYFAQALGAEATLISRVGDDALGDETLARLAALGLPTSGVTRDPEHETGKATVALDQRGVPQFTIHSPRGVGFSASLARALRDRRCRRTRFASERSAAAMPSRARRFARWSRARSPAAWRVLDLNLRAPFYDQEVITEGLQLANALKLNEDELAVLTTMFALEGGELERLHALQSRWELHAIVLTKGAAGSLLLHTIRCPGTRASRWK